MYKDHCLKLCSYNLWANERIVSMTDAVGEERGHQEIVSSFPSIRKTLAHIWDAEIIWYKRLHGDAINYWPSKDFKGNLKELGASLLVSSNSFLDYVSEMDEEFLLSMHSYNTLDGKPYEHPVHDIIQHVVNHGTFHRGQIVTLLRQLGEDNLAATDFIDFSRQPSKI